mgnify:CR=1 FL=1
MIYHGTEATLIINGKEIPIKAWAVESATPDPAEPISPPRFFEFEVSFRWTWIAPFAFSLPPAGCVPMFN